METPLEQQVAALLAGSKAFINEWGEFSEGVKKGIEGLTARETMERKAELSHDQGLSEV